MKTVKLSDLKPNKDNPRTIKKEAMESLKKSVTEFSEMTEVRPIVVNKDMEILGGNMRYRAMKEAGLEKTPVIIVDWPKAKQQEFIIKDNVSGGDWDWDALADSWNAIELQEWGLEVPSDFLDEDDFTEKPDDKEMSAVVVVAYENINDLDKLTDFYNLEAVDMTEQIRNDLSGQRKAYVFKK